MPLILSLMELRSGILQEVVDLLGLHKLGDIQEFAVASINALGDTLLDEELVLLGGVALDVLSCWGDAVLEGTF